jgi:hypothetical protein
VVLAETVEMADVAVMLLITIYIVVVAPDMADAAAMAVRLKLDNLAETGHPVVMV